MSDKLENVRVYEARLTDDKLIERLNKKWYRPNLASLENGYIGAELSPATIRELIDRKQIAIATNDLVIAGYYLLNDFSKEGVIGRHEEIVQSLRRTGQIDSGLKVGIGAQVVVDNDFMGSGLRQLMLRQLATQLRGKFDLIFGTIGKDNPRSKKANINDGWTINGEDEKLLYVTFDIRQVS